MATPIIMPRQGQSVESCILVTWLVSKGDPVQKGSPLASIETDKAVFEVEAPATGVLLDQFFENGSDVPVLTCIGAIGEEGEDASDLRPGARLGSTGMSANFGASESSVSAEIAQSPSDKTLSEAKVLNSGVSPRAKTRAARSGIDPKTLEGTGPGGRIIERDVLVAAHTQPRLTPVARAAVGIDRVAGPGTGLGGQVRQTDLVAPLSLQSDAGQRLEIPVRGIRKLIASRMRQSLASTAQLTLNRRFDASQLMATRAWIKDRVALENMSNSTINDMILYVLARTLSQHPEINAHFLGDRIVQFKSVHLGVAIDTPRGLMVPVIRNAQDLSLSQMTAAVRSLSEACQKGSVSPDALTGGTFTLTTLGALDIESFTPVLNVPEVGILGVGGITQTAVPAENETGMRFVPMMSLSLTLDHQAVDGAPGARFLQELARGLEQLDPIGIRPPG